MPTLVDRSETLAVEVACSDDALTVVLDDGRTVSVPLVWFPRLLNATPKQRKEWSLSAAGSAFTGNRSTKTSLWQAC